MQFFRHLILVLLFLMACTGTALAQGTTDKRAEKAYKEAVGEVQSRNFGKALELYNQAIERDPAFGEAYVRAAALYRILQQQEKAFDYYAKGLEKLPPNNAFSADYLSFADLAFAKGESDLAAKYYNLYLQVAGKSSRYSSHAQKQLDNLAFAQQAKANPVPFRPQPLSATVNRFGLQYSPVLTADQRSLLFTARNGSGPYDDENLFLSTLKDGEWQAPVSISETINTNLNEGAASLSGDGRILVFTSCNRQDSYGGCDLYISYREGDTWSKPRNMGKTVNTSAWDSQPSLSADGRTLYFSSNRNGGHGKEDIYVTHYQDGKGWGLPENLGRGINTSGRDTSPLLHASGNTLYYATDGFSGMGGLDLFMSSKKGASWTKPENMGYPLNTHLDETSIFISPDNTLGYYSSQQPSGGKLEVALVQIEVPDKWKAASTSSFAQGKVFSAKSKEPLAAQVQVYDLDSVGVVAQQVNSDPNTGEYTIVVNKGQRYALYVTAPGHVLESRHISATSTSKPLALDFFLQPLGKGAKAVLSNLFFDTGKSTLRPESRTELDKLFQFLKANPTIKVEIAGHTDNVGNAAANQKLSEARAKAVVNYLVSKGAPAALFQAKGYGDTQPAAPNNSEENRQLNRRIEMRVL